MRFYPSDSLEPGMQLGRDIINTNNAFMLKKGVTLTEEYVQYLRKKGYIGAYVSDEYSEGIEPEEPISTKTLEEGINSLMNSDIDGMVSSANRIVSDISSLKQLSVDILNLRSFDDYTYHHSVNVAVYAVAVGKYMGLSHDELVALSQAGICHDLGKQMIPIEILNKPAKLTDEEFELIKKHPQYSFDILHNNNEISSVVRQAVVLHHENENGSGYPFGRSGSQIPLIAKILHCVDVFDALTSKRPYKDPYTPYDAYEYMIGGKDILFNGEVVDAMRKVIPTYPMGMEVGLSSGKAAIVIANTDDPLRPIIRMKDTLATIDLTVPENRDIFITSSGYLTLEYSGAVEELNEARQNTAKKTFTILVVDDSSISRMQTVSALKKDNYKLICLQSGVAALNYIKTREEPDLIIMDIEMPMMNGISAVAHIRELGHENLPVIFLTAKGDMETVLKCKSVGAKDYIIKPVLPTYLKERVAIALNEQDER